jgi:hypothetical protein
MKYVGLVLLPFLFAFTACPPNPVPPVNVLDGGTNVVLVDSGADASVYQQACVIMNNLGCKRDLSVCAGVLQQAAGEPAIGISAKAVPCVLKAQSKADVLACGFDCP